MNAPPSQHEHDLAILAAGGETGWWDDDGRPAPWPTDFFDPDSGWRIETYDPPQLAPGEPPF